MLGCTEGVAGYYRIGAYVRLTMDKKPSRWHRLWVRWLLNWDWEDSAQAGISFEPAQNGFRWDTDDMSCQPIYPKLPEV